MRHNATTPSALRQELENDDKYRAGRAAEVIEITHCPVANVDSCTTDRRNERTDERTLLQQFSPIINVPHLALYSSA